MLDWVGEPFNAAEGAFTIDPALTEAGPSLAPFDPLLGRTRRKAADGVADAVKAELYDSEDLEYAHYGQHDPAEEPRVGASEFSRTKRKATEGLLDILRAEAPDSDEVDQLDDIKDALGQTGTTAGQQGLLAQNSVAAAGCRSLRAPNKRKKTARSIEGAAQELLEEGEGAGDGPQSSRLRRERWTVAETQALLQGESCRLSSLTSFERVSHPQLPNWSRSRGRRSSGSVSRKCDDLSSSPNTSGVRPGSSKRRTRFTIASASSRARPP